MKRIIFIDILIFAFCLAALAQNNENQCPEIKLILSSRMPVPNVPITFMAKVGENIEKYNLSYEWTVSKGKILQGQGTSIVEFLATEEDAGTNFNVFVKVNGLPKDCSDSYSDVLGIDSLPIEEPYEILGKPVKKRLGLYKARIESFIFPIKDYPNSEGLITVRFEKNESRISKISRLRKIYNVFIFRKFDLTRITFAISEDNYPEETTLWLIPPSAMFPKYVKDYTIIKAEEFEQKIKELFPKR